MLIIKSKLGQFAELDGKYYKVSADFADSLNDKVAAQIKEACRRARDNNRNTVMPRDL